MRDSAESKHARSAESGEAAHTVERARPSLTPAPQAQPHQPPVTSITAPISHAHVYNVITKHT